MRIKDIAIGKKIGYGFGIVLVLLALAGVISIFGIKGIVKNAKDVIEGNRLDSVLAQQEVDHLVWAQQLNAFLNDYQVDKLSVQLDHKKCAFGKWFYGNGRIEAQKRIPALKPILDGMEESHRLLHESAKKIKQAFLRPHPGLRTKLWGIVSGHLEWTKKVLLKLNDVLDSTTNFDPAKFKLGVQFDPQKCLMGQFLAKPETKKIMATFPEFKVAMEKMDKSHVAMHKSAALIETLLKKGNTQEALRVFHNQTLPCLKQVKSSLLEAIEAETRIKKGFNSAMDVFNRVTQPNLQKIKTSLHELRKTAKSNLITDEAMLELAQNTQMQVGILIVAALFIGVLIAFGITKAITRPLALTEKAVHKVAQGDLAFFMPEIEQAGNDELGKMLKAVEDMRHRLSDTVREVVAASDNVAQSSVELSQGNQDLSERTQTQASAIEEIASAMEEMTSSVSNNAYHAEKANQVAQEAVDTAQNGGKAVSSAVKAMGQIKESSDKISEITDVVNEIAFQTNLLALNAAVEAARAGESGRGFAVVATEVRNLAGRSASSAKEIQNLINDSLSKVDQGNRLVKESGDLLESIIEKSKAMAQVISEITSAGQEQSQGVQEINQAVNHMDNAVQQNAALVEEAASASENQAIAAEELRSQMSQFKV